LKKPGQQQGAGNAKPRHYHAAGGGANQRHGQAEALGQDIGVDLRCLDWSF